MRLFNGMARASEVIQGIGSFVGLKLVRKECSVNIIKIGHQFDFPCMIEILVYRDNELIRSFIINHQKPNIMQWSDFELNLEDGEYHVGYIQGVSKALRKDYAWRKEPCKCDHEGHRDYMRYSKCLDAVGFHGFESINTTSNYGLNLEFTIG